MSVYHNISGFICKAATCIAALFLLSAGGVFASEKSERVLVIGARLDGRLDEDPKSGYNQLAANIFKNADGAVFQRLPMVRAITTFAREERVCLMPTSPEILSLLGNVDFEILVASDPIDIVSSHFFFRTRAEIDPLVFANPDRHIAKQSGLDLQDVLGDQLKATVTHVPEMVIALRMLEARRVDAMYAWYPDVMIISERDGLMPPQFDPHEGDIEINTTLTCKSFDGVHAVLAQFNTRLAKLRHSGQLERMLGPYARLADR